MCTIDLAEIYDWECGFFFPHLEHDVDFWSRTLANNDKPILELGAGTGRISIPLAKTGHRISALDISASMLEILQKKAENLKIDVIQGDMRSFNFAESYHTIFIPYSAFQLLRSAEQQKQCLQSIYRSLAKGGQLIMDIDQKVLAGKDTADFQHEYTELHEKSGSIISMHSKNHTDYAEQTRTWEDVYRIFQDGKKKLLRNSVTLKSISLDYIELLLNLEKFEMTDVFGGYNNEILTQNSERLIVFARKA